MHGTWFLIGSSLWVPNKDYMADGQSTRFLECTRNQLFHEMCENTSVLSKLRTIRRRLFVFFISLKTSGKQMEVYHSELTVPRSYKSTYRMTRFTKKNKRTFVKNCSENEQPFLVSVHLEAPTQSTAAYVLDHKLRSMFRYLL